MHDKEIMVKLNKISNTFLITLKLKRKETWKNSLKIAVELSLNNYKKISSSLFYYGCMGLFSI